MSASLQDRLDPHARAIMRDAVLAEIASESIEAARRPAPRWWRKPGWVAGITGALLVAGAGTATAAVIHFRSVAADPVRYSRCYGALSTEFRDGKFPGVTMAIAPANEPFTTGTFSDPVPACVQAWQAGVLPLHEGKNDGSLNHPVPDLVSCVTSKGDVYVFPGRAGVCDSLGLAEDSNSVPYLAR